MATAKDGPEDPSPSLRSFDLYEPRLTPTTTASIRVRTPSLDSAFSRYLVARRP